MEPNEQAVRAAHSAWIDAVNRGDVSLLLAAMTEDAVFLNPGQAPLGRQEFPSGFSSAHQRAWIRCTSELQELVVVGDLAYTRCRDALSVTPRAGGESMQLAGDRITIYRQQPDGRWLLARDAHTLSPVPA